MNLMTASNQWMNRPADQRFECPKCGLENIEATRFCGIDETDPSDLAPV